MQVWLVIAAQASAVAGPPSSVPFQLTAKSSCKADAAAGEVVVCGRAESPYRYKPLPPVDAPLLPKAETSLLGGHASVEGEAGDVGGIPTNRIMARIRRPF